MESKKEENGPEVGEKKNENSNKKEGIILSGKEDFKNRKDERFQEKKRGITK